MPKRTDIKSILIVGAGPMVVGQACGFDYSGTQACKALKEEGYRIILVNSNPATIMTDPGVADATYVEPITPDEVGRDRLDIGGVGYPRIGHDRGRVRVHQDDAIALFFQGLARLRSGIVEPAGLADDHRPSPDDQDGLYICALGHRP